MEKRNFAMDLRVRLVREVAAPYFKAIDLEKSKDIIADEIRAAEALKEKRFSEFSAKMVESVKQSLKEDEVLKEKRECEEWFKECESRIADLKSTVADQVALLSASRRKAHENLQKIVAEVLAGNFGRGEIYLTPQGLGRIFGRIDTSESMGLCGIYVSVKNLHGIGQQIKQLCEACRDNFPQVHIEINLMPLDAEEVLRLCYQHDDYFLLKKFISNDLIPWKLNSIYCIRKKSNESYEIYLVGLTCNIAIVKVERGTYPNYTFEALGKLEKLDKNFIDMELKYWDGRSKQEWFNGEKRVPWPVAECSEQEIDMSISMLSKHLYEKHPGIICHWPQIESRV